MDSAADAVPERRSRLHPISTAAPRNIHLGLPDCGPGGRTGRLHAPPEVSMNNRRTWIIAATLAVLAGGGCWWAFADGEDAALITAPARVAGLEKTVQAVGRVNPKELVAVGAQVSGQVTRLHVVLGQHVQAGDLIAEVDSQPQRIALRSAEAAANALRARSEEHTSELQSRLHLACR